MRGHTEVALSLIAAGVSVNQAKVGVGRYSRTQVEGHVGYLLGECCEKSVPLCVMYRMMAWGRCIWHALRVMLPPWLRS